MQSIHPLPYGTKHPTTNGLILPGTGSDRCFPGDKLTLSCKEWAEGIHRLFWEPNNKHSMILKQFHICEVKFWCWV